MIKNNYSNTDFSKEIDFTDWQEFLKITNLFVKQ